MSDNVRHARTAYWHGSRSARRASRRLAPSENQSAVGTCFESFCSPTYTHIYIFVLYYLLVCRYIIYSTYNSALLSLALGMPMLVWPAGGAAAGLDSPDAEGCTPSWCTTQHAWLLLCRPCRVELGAASPRHARPFPVSTKQGAARFQLTNRGEPLWILTLDLHQRPLVQTHAARLCCAECLVNVSPLLQ